MIKEIKTIFLPCEENNYRPKFLAGNFLFYYAILILFLKLSLFPFFLYLPKSTFFAAVTKSALLELVNQTRKASQLPLLKENPALTQAAYLKAKDMIEKQYFGHKSPEGKWLVDWLKSVNYQYALAGENLAIGFVDSEEVHQAWLASFSHRANILNPKYQEIGIAVLKGKFDGAETTVVVQLFGTPKVLAQKNEVEQTEILEKVPEKSAKATSESEVLPPTELEKPKANFPFQVLKFMTLHYNHFVQKFVYGSLFFVIFALLINIFVKIEVQHPDIIFKTFIFIVLLSFFLWLDKSEMIKLIPHQLQIY